MRISAVRIVRRVRPIRCCGGMAPKEQHPLSAKNMGHIHHSDVCIRLFGDDLDPDEVTALLGAQPTTACRKGDELVGRTGRVRIAKTGSWRLSATRREPEDLEAQIFELLDQLTQDLRSWSSLTERYRTDLFCGIFMGSFNDGLPISAKALLALGQRGIDLDLDIYEASD